MHRTHGIPRPILFFALTFALPLAAAGCDKRACFFWTEAEGACPAQDEAIDFFGDGFCESPIESVDSEGDFDGELCCYDITETGAGDVACDSGGVGAGAGGFGSTAASSGTGGSCQHCGSFANSFFTGGAGIVPGNLCPISQELYLAMQGCLCSGSCSGSGSLASDCPFNTCAGSQASTACFDCGTAPVEGCGNEFTACANDI
jgi:hypothetical protein